MKVGCQAGAARMRNDAISAMISVPRGATALRDWCQLWADGAVPPPVATMFVTQVIKPLSKPNGKARPIALLEVLFKLASGVLLDTLRKKDASDGCDWNQYGQHPAGPELMLQVGLGLMRARPDLAYIPLDLTNAFGCARRSTMLKATCKYAPGHAKFLRLL